tara:strand:- start:1383 stop:2150 length:768 start_codon:yes stop_codon:yes gene_type:complete
VRIGTTIGIATAGKPAASGGTPAGPLKVSVEADTDVYEDTGATDPVENGDFAVRWLDATNGLQLAGEGDTNQPQWYSSSANWNNKPYIDYYAYWFEQHVVDVTGMSTSTDHTIYALHRGTIPLDGQPIMHTSNLSCWYKTTSGPSGFDDGTLRTSTYWPGTFSGLWVFSFNGVAGGAKIHVNGWEAYGSPLTYTPQQLTGNLTLMTTGGTPSAGSNYASYGELLLFRWYDVLHTNAERVAIETELRTKYAFPDWS